MIVRRKTREVKVRNIGIGGDNPISIQSMTNTPTTDVKATVDQIKRLTAAGCDIVRVAIPDVSSADAFKEIRAEIDTPLVADIHFQYKLALSALDAGVDKIRINPGNIGSQERVKAVIDAAKDKGAAVRIGVNAGSLDKKLLEKYGGPTYEALVESALEYVEMMNNFSFDQFVLSIKASDVITTIDACKLLSEKCDFPQHIGITESGTVRTGSIISAVGIGALLSAGVGDTLRVSLSGDPVEEIYVAKEILKSLKLAEGPKIIACPTCGRTRISVSKLAEEVEKIASDITVPIKIAVMGCIVNGPGEAREADVGIAGGNGTGMIFIKGEEVERVDEKDLLSTFRRYIDKAVEEYKKS